MRKVMVVDDDRTMVKLLQTLLELDGFRVVHASAGADVLPVVLAESPDVILMDVHLADADGLEVLKELHAAEHMPRPPVIMTSGLDVEEECKRAGASAFILKPYRPEELSQAIHRVLGS